MESVRKASSDLRPFEVGPVPPQRSSGGDWLRLLLLCAGDIERNPGPGIGKSYYVILRCTIINCAFNHFGVFQQP